MNIYDNWDIVNALYERGLEDYRQLPEPVRHAYAFDGCLQQLPISIDVDKIFVGDFGWACLSESQGQEWKNNIELWHLSQVSPSPTAEDLVAEQMLQSFHCFGSYATSHTCPDYAYLFHRGLSGLLKDIDTQRAHSHYPHQQDYLRGMQVGVEAVLKFAKRYHDLARQMALNSKYGEHKERLERFSYNCQQVPRYSPRNVEQGLQFIWFIHLAIGISERDGASLSLGRLDQVLYPYFLENIDRRVTKNDFEMMLTEFFERLNTFGDAACNINLGGLSQHGADMFNPLSQMILDVVKKNRLPAPLVSVRVHPGMNETFFDNCLSPELAEIGQPTFYGELPCRKTLARRGVADKDILHWAANNCMGLIIPGKEIANMWAAVVNMLLPLELAMNQGRAFMYELPIRCKSAGLAEYENFDELYAMTLSYFEELLDYCLGRCEQATRDAGHQRPNPFLTVLYDEAIAKGRDRALGATTYHTATVETFGLANLGNALYAVKELVYETGDYSLQQLTHAAITNYKENMGLLGRVRSLPKYGNDEAEVDELMQRLVRDVAERIGARKHRYWQYVPSLHTLNGHVTMGIKTAASLDGRCAGEALAKNAGPTAGSFREAHTALIKSAASLDQSQFTGGQALDISIDLKMLEDSESRKKFKQLLETYFELGGLQLQVNGVSAETLRSARACPDQHEHVIVKIAGYSERFVRLTEAVQDEMIERFAMGL